MMGVLGVWETSIRVPPKNLELIFFMCLQDSALRKMLRNTALWGAFQSSLRNNFWWIVPILVVRKFYENMGIMSNPFQIQIFFRFRASRSWHWNVFSTISDLNGKWFCFQSLLLTNGAPNLAWSGTTTTSRSGPTLRWTPFLSASSLPSKIRFF